MARLKPQFIPPEELSEDDLASIIQLARQQVVKMDELEAALQSGDTERALRAAADLVGLQRKVRER